jgi:Na+(H+)/acetate symporter ActP
MGLSWGVLAGCFIGPYVLGLLCKKVSRPAVWCSVIGTLVLTLVLIFVFGYDKNGWDCTLAFALKTGIGCSPMIGVICMAYSMVVTAIVSLFTKPCEKGVQVAFDGGMYKTNAQENEMKNERKGSEKI